MHSIVVWLQDGMPCLQISNHVRRSGHIQVRVNLVKKFSLSLSPPSLQTYKHTQTQFSHSSPKCGRGLKNDQTGCLYQWKRSNHKKYVQSLVHLLGGNTRDNKNWRVWSWQLMTCVCPYYRPLWLTRHFISRIKPYSTCLFSEHCFYWRFIRRPYD